MTDRSGMSRRQALMAGGLVAAAPLLTAMRRVGKPSGMCQDSGWQWCCDCQGLWYGDNDSGGCCPAGGCHEFSDCYDYTLSYDNYGGGGGNCETNWRWCCECQGLWYAADGSGGCCPAGGCHSRSDSNNYMLIYDNSGGGGSGNCETDWRRCCECQGLWYAGDGSGGWCPAGGCHTFGDSNDYVLGYSQDRRSAVRRTARR